MTRLRSINGLKTTDLLITHECPDAGIISFLVWDEWINIVQSLVRFFGVLIAAAVLPSGCANIGKLSEGSAEMAQVPITENSSGKAYPGKFIWHDLLTPDPLSAGKFYEELFGWQIEYQGRYTVVRNDGKLIAGILQVVPADGSTRDYDTCQTHAHREIAAIPSPSLC